MLPSEAYYCTSSSDAAPGLNIIRRDDFEHVSPDCQMAVRVVEKGQGISWLAAISDGLEPQHTVDFVLVPGLKIRVSAVQFCPGPPINSLAYGSRYPFPRIFCVSCA